jgi:hypothetical protein
MLVVATSGFDRCEGGGVTTPQRISALESANAPHVLQAEPAVSFFGGQGSPIWVVCHNDSTHRGDPHPNASGITCEIQDQRREFSMRVVVNGFSPFPTSDPFPATDPTLAKDPTNPNLLWLAAIMNWDTVAGGKRTSLGVAKLVRNPTTREVVVSDPNPGPGGDTHRMIPIWGTGIEGPSQSSNGPVPDRPFMAIDPTPDELGHHSQYIAFFQNDNSLRDQNQFGRGRGRIMVTRRDSDQERFWSAPVVVRATGVETDTDGWAIDNDAYQFLSPQLAIHPRTHQVGITFVRFQLQGDSGANVTLDNSEFVGRRIFYFVGVSPDRARTGWSVLGIGWVATAGNINMGPATFPSPSTFTAAPYPALAFDGAFNRWVLVYPTLTQANTGHWELDSTFSADGSVWSTPVKVNTSPSFSLSGPRNAVFPSLAFDPQARRLTVGYLESNDIAERTWRPLISFSSNGGNSWGPPHEIVAASSPRGSRLREYGWGGHWEGSSRAGFFGDYTGLTNSGGTVFFAWTESRDSTSTSIMDVWGAESTLSDE